jgi:SAM-dependent methyltransferase
VRGFNSFRAIPQNAHLGAHAELGCGPWTQTLTSLMKARPDLTFSSVTLSDPNLVKYMTTTATCSYQSGALVPGLTTYLLAAGAEAPIFNEVFDTVMMVNVLEHVQNGYAILENLYRMLKPGGLLIFNDRWWEELPNVHVDDNILHPVRIKRIVFEHFLARFDPLFRDDAGTAEMHARGSLEHGCYVIARKR